MPDGAGVAKPGREAVRRCGGRILRGGQSGLGPRGAAVDVDVERLHIRQVEHDPALGDAVTGRTVAAAAHGQLEPGRPGERDHVCDVRRVGDLDDDRRPAVDRTGHDGSGLVVLVVVRRDHAARDVGAEFGDGVGVRG